MLEESLLERLRYIESHPEARGAKDASRGVRSIINHLRRLLNTKQGSVQIGAEYGMPDITNYPGEHLDGMAREVESVLGEVVHRYEPRLRNVKIKFDPDGKDVLALRFKFEADIVIDRNRVMPIVFETIVTSSGMVKVES